MLRDEQALADRKKLQPDRRDLVVAPDDGVGYGAVVRAMDVATARGFSTLSVAEAVGQN